MNYQKLCDFFGGPTKAAEALGIDGRQTVAAWKNRRIPSKWQIKAQSVSKGALKADQEAHAEAAEISRDLTAVDKRAAA